MVGVLVIIKLVVVLLCGLRAPHTVMPQEVTVVVNSTVCAFLTLCNQPLLLIIKYCVTNEWVECTLIL